MPGKHHFYISFETAHPGVDIPSWLRDKYPDEMTIVLQDWFDDLAVTKDRFSVTLNFSDTAETLVIPFAAVRTFVDPSVKFGLKFDAHDPDESDVPDDLIFDDEDEHEDGDSDNDNNGGGDSQKPPEKGKDVGADIVSLDKFRKH